MTALELTKANYFSVEASKSFCGATQFKSLVPDLGGCEVMGMAMINGLYTFPVSTDMLLGKAIHAWSEGTLDQFKHKNMDELTKKDGVTFLAKYRWIQDCINAIENDENMMMVINGEKEKIVTAEWGGLQWKVMFDVINNGMGFFTDLKIMKDFEPIWSKRKKEYVSWVEAWGYDYQIAIYAETQRVATSSEDWFYPHIAAVTKHDPPDTDIFIDFYDAIPYLLETIKAYLPRIIELKSGLVEPIPCGKCECCRSKKKARFVSYRTLEVVE